MQELQPGVTYTLKYSGQFCHALGQKGYKTFSKNENDEDRIQAIFVGTIEVSLGKRNIFYATTSNNRTYLMFSCESLDYIDENK